MTRLVAQRNGVTGFDQVDQGREVLVEEGERKTSKFYLFTRRRNSKLISCILIILFIVSRGGSIEVEVARSRPKRFQNQTIFQKHIGCGDDEGQEHAAEEHLGFLGHQLNHLAEVEEEVPAR